jgi:hypothetical protein
MLGHQPVREYGADHGAGKPVAVGSLRSELPSDQPAQPGAGVLGILERDDGDRLAGLPQAAGQEWRDGVEVARADGRADQIRGADRGFNLRARANCVTTGARPTRVSA